MSFMKVISNPRGRQYKETLEWVGGKINPDAFDLQDVNTRLIRMGRGRSEEVNNPWYMADPMEAEKREIMTKPLSKPMPESFHPALETLPLRRDVIALITYIRDN